MLILLTAMAVPSGGSISHCHWFYSTPYCVLFLTYQCHYTTLDIQKICEMNVVRNYFKSTWCPSLECWNRALVCFQKASGDWQRWWRMRYHENKVCDVLKDGKNRFLACKPTQMVGGHVLHQIFALAEWRLCRIEVTGRTDTGSSVHGAKTSG